MAQRWVFHDPVTDESYTFVVNPNEGGTPSRKKKLGYQATTAPDGAVIMYEGREEPQNTEVSGTILYRLQYDAMIEWFDKRHPVEVTDDLDRIMTIYITDFEAKRVRSRNYPWKHTFTMKYIVLSIEMPEPTAIDLAYAEQ